MFRSKKQKEDLEYYKVVAEQQKKAKNTKHEKISTDFSLFISLLKDLLIFIIMLIPNILGFFLSLLFAKKEKAKHYIEKIIYEPFEIIRKIINWFFESQITSFLIISLILMYAIEIYFFVPNNLMNSLMTHPSHLSQGNYWSLLTSIFLHGDLVHLLTNCLALLIFGRIVEKQVGFNTLFLFVASGIIASFVSNMIALYLNDIYYSLGASGAIAGIIMFAILFNPLAFTSIFIVPLPIFIVGWAIIALDIIGLSNPSQTNHLAHLGGYSALLILFFFMELRHRKKIIAGISLNALLLLAFFILTRIIDFSVWV